MGCDIEIVKCRRQQFDSLAGPTRSVQSQRIPHDAVTILGEYRKYYHMVMFALSTNSDFSASQFDYIELTPQAWKAVRQRLLTAEWEEGQVVRNEEFIRDMHRFFQETDLEEDIILLYWD